MMRAILEVLDTAPAQDYRVYLDLLALILSVADSYQSKRLTYALQYRKDFFGLFEQMARHRARFPRKTYLIFKLVLELRSS